MNRPLRRMAVALSLAATSGLFNAGTAHAAAIVVDNTIVDVIPGLTGFATSGAEMTGLAVTATFANGFSETLAWFTDGPNSGRVTGTGWSLALSGDTFSADWVFTRVAGAAVPPLISLSLDGTGALVVLDRDFLPFPGTPDSADGTDFVVNSDAVLDAATSATYSRQVAVSPNAPVGDLYHRIDINFGNGTSNNFSFRQDTDNDSRFRTPVPATLSLAGLALLGLGAGRRRG